MLFISNYINVSVRSLPWLYLNGSVNETLEVPHIGPLIGG